MAPILLGRVGNVVDEAGTDGAPHGDEAIVGHGITPDEDEANVEDVADEANVEEVADVDAEGSKQIYLSKTPGSMVRLNLGPLRPKFSKRVWSASAYAGQLMRPGQVSSLASTSSRRRRCCR